MADQQLTGSSLRKGGPELKRRTALTTFTKPLNYRVLYFFHGRNVAIVSHGFTKKAEVLSREINEAIK